VAQTAETAQTARTAQTAQTAGFAGLAALPRLRTAVELAADAIRLHIFEGRFRPAAALPETALARSLGVSRNTVREALRMLVNEHLLTIEPHKGAAVRRLDILDVRDIYRTRRLLELTAIDALRESGRPLPPAAFADSLADADAAATAGDWAAVGTANLRFHTEIVALHESARFDEFFTRLMTEMRLGFLALDDPEAFHAPYLPRNHALAAQLRGGACDAARSALAAYLDEAGDQVMAAVVATRADE
jgi:DNA-binding GntR family transcriptional regulator